VLVRLVLAAAANSDQVSQSALAALTDWRVLYLSRLQAIIEIKRRTPSTAEAMADLLLTAMGGPGVSKVGASLV